MLMKCCNPKCEAPFNYREGRLIRFSKKVNSSKSPENRLLIQHFWLCEKCSALYVFEFEAETSVKIKPRRQESSAEKLSYFVSAA
jgi:hypothetical protein